MPKKPAAAASRWLFKTEPTTFSYEDLEAKKDGDVWDGVKNAVALKHLAQIRRGDEILIYHTGEEKAVVGVARALRDPYPDPKQDDPKLLVVDVKAVRRLPFPVPLSVLKKEPRYAEFDLVRLPRLSVMPVPAELWEDVLARGGLK